MTPLENQSRNSSEEPGSTTSWRLPCRLCFCPKSSDSTPRFTAKLFCRWKVKAHALLCGEAELHLINLSLSSRLFTALKKKKSIWLIKLILFFSLKHLFKPYFSSLISYFMNGGNRDRFTSSSFEKPLFPLQANISLVSDTPPALVQAHTRNPELDSQAPLLLHYLHVPRVSEPTGLPLSYLLRRKDKIWGDFMFLEERASG